MYVHGRSGIARPVLKVQADFFDNKIERIGSFVKKDFRLKKKGREIAIMSVSNTGLWR